MMRARRHILWAAAVVIGAVLLATKARLAPTTPVLDGSWSGTVDVVPGRAHGTATGSLSQSGRGVTGTMTLAAAGVSGTFAASGALRGTRASLAGALGTQRLRWRARWSRQQHLWRGPLVVRDGKHRMRGLLVLARDEGPVPLCGGEYFASDVMPTVLEPVCSQCHAPGGQAQASAFRVTAGDPTTTARNALRQVDPADPLHSKLIEKPRADVAHGGGQRVLPGSAEEQVLQHWIGLVSAPGCGGGNGGGGTGPELFADNCASCHGTDARGLQTGPDIHCSRSIAGVVRSGRKGAAAEMPAFPKLTDADIDKVQAYLGGLCPATTATGADLFAGNCAACHGTDATGTPGIPGIRCATRVVDAVRNGRGPAMPSIPALTDAEVALVDGHLGDMCTQNGRTGGDLWTGNCGTCHGETAHGGQNGLGVSGPDVHCSRNITTPVKAGQGADMPAFPGLTTPDVATLQQYLTASFCPAGTATGADLYASNCASCHGAGAAGSATAPDVRCATRLDDALTVGRGTKMSAFPGIAGADRTNLQAYLGQLCTQAGRTPTAVYAANCASCHGGTAHGGQDALGVVGPDIHCSRNITAPVKAGQGTAMPAFPGLANTDVTSLQQYLMTSFCPAGTATGADLFASNCASCHGTDARGVNGNPNIRCNRGIHDPVLLGRVGPAGTMPAFSMTDPEIALVQSHLVGLCPSGTASGSDLYAGNCATCHGTDGGGTAGAPSVRCATLVADAVQVGRGAGMPSFPALVGTDLSSVETHLAQLCVQHGRTGSDMYAGNCSTCHGADAGGGRNGLGVAGPDIRCTGANDYQDKVRNGDDKMPRFPALNTTDVTTIVDFVHGTFCPGG